MMQLYKRLKMISSRGSVLILTLWTLVFLSVFAVQIGLGIRQRIALMSRLEGRSQLRFMGESGIKKAIAVLSAETNVQQENYSATGKALRHNNKDQFKGLKIGEGEVDVAYFDLTYGIKGADILYGFVDEERKVNLNTADHQTMKTLFEEALNLKEDEARDLADAMIGWREFGDTELTGFYSDDYYSTLPFPYEPKNAEFETLEELLLVKGVDAFLLEKIIQYATIYGDGRINMNTASLPVLKAMGCSLELVEKIDMVRRGADGLESTGDDHIFNKTYDIVSEILSFTELSIDDINKLDLINATGGIKTTSRYYSITAIARFKKLSMTSFCVYNSFENRLETYREK